MKNALPDGHFHGGDIYAYRWLAQHLPHGGTHVELGPYRGRSICAISGVLLERKIHVTLVDSFVGLPPDSRHTEVVSGTRYEDSETLRRVLETNVARFGLEPTIYAEDSASVARRFPDESVDMVFIDADHQYDAVLRDLTAWWPKITPTGRIAGHDYSAELDRPSGKRNYGASGGYHVAPALRTFFQLQREVKRAPRQQQTTVWYVNRNPADDLVLHVTSADVSDRPDGIVARRQRRIVELILALDHPTRERAIYAVAADPETDCHLGASSSHISRLIKSGHLELVPRGAVTS